MEIYSIQRFYFEVKAMIEKSPRLVKEIGNSVIEVGFEIVEINGQAHLKCSINNTFHDVYEKVKTGKEYLLGIYSEPSPANALSKLQQLVNEYNGINLSERIGTEI